mmetsp:Transcript_8797/g.6539  ORF Transcript_8797/g.6539 Transcript_8797/m.6539 type:complete len:120 (+) Transcript_8797:750-1109(+)
MTHKEAEELFLREMGFSLVVEMLVKAGKTLIGHNMIYDMVFMYTQFITELPPTYKQFIAEWQKRFPLCYDTKILSVVSCSFGNSALVPVYSKCVGDHKLKNLVHFNFDSQNKFTKYAML